MQTPLEVMVPAVFSKMAPIRMAQVIRAQMAEW